MNKTSGWGSLQLEGNPGPGTPPRLIRSWATSGGLDALGLPISDLGGYIPFLKKRYIGPFLAGSLFREKLTKQVAGVAYS